MLEGNLLPRKSHFKSILSSAGHFSTRVGMSTSEKIAAFESNDFELDDTTSMDSAPIGPLRMYQGHKTLECRQISDLAKFLRTGKKNFLGRTTKNQRYYSLETAITDYRQDRGSYRRELRHGRFSGYRSLPRYSCRGLLNLSIIQSRSKHLQT